MMNYLIYKTTNTINGKIYIGCHKTDNINDGYMGSGKVLNQAISKYGIDNFTKEILHIFDNPEDMFKMEAQLVNEDFVTDENTYNLKEGGYGGFDHINNDSKIKEKRRAAIRQTFDGMSAEERKEKFGRCGENNHNYGKSLPPETKEKLSKANTGKKYSAEVNKKKSRPGELNGMHGKHHSEKTLEKLRRPKTEEHKKKLSEAKKGKKQEIVECPFCNKQGGIANMKRYHFEYCKEK